MTEGRLRCRFLEVSGDPRFSSLRRHAVEPNPPLALGREASTGASPRRRLGRAPPTQSCHGQPCSILRRPATRNEGRRAGRLRLAGAAHPPTGQFTTRSLDVDGLTTHATAAQQLGQPLAELGLGGRSDADVGLWGRLIIATLVLDKPIVLRGRVLEHPEGIAGRADSRLRFALTA